jgi:uncharacterized surface protein with fasciclin (FAS1) repeats
VSANDATDIVQTAIDAGKFKTLVTAVKAAGLVDVAKLPEGAVETLLKPENKEKLKAILLYHVVQGKVTAEQVVSLKSAKTQFGQDINIRVKGGQVRLNDAKVLKTDILASNGVIHIVDSVLLPKDIVDLAIDANFNTLVKAVKAADLVATLKSDGPFTVFAPTDAAFAKLPEGTLANLLKPENIKKLQGILTYHVVAGRFMASDVVALNTVKTVNGQKATIKVKSGEVFIDNARVIETDIVGTNGVIHVIDDVILPEM